MKSTIIATSQFGIKVEDNANWLNANDFKMVELIKTLKRGDVVEYDFTQRTTRQGKEVLKLTKLAKLSQLITPPKEAKQILGDYICSICNNGYIDCKTKLLCEQNHYLKDIGDTLRARLGMM